MLRSARAAAAKARRPKRPVVYGSGKVDIGAGKTLRVKIKLSRAGKALVRKRRRAKVYATVTHRSGETASSRITLKR